MKKKDYWVWIDLEMSGLNPDTDKILEIATIITDKELNIIAEGPELVINQPNQVLQSMDEWNTNQHGKSGLTEKVYASNITTEMAEKMTLEFIKQYCGPKESPLCGSSVYQDKLFLRKYMPKINNYLHYRLVDVTTVKLLARAWYKDNPNLELKKSESHRALDDIRESVQELKHYKKLFFV